MSPSIRELALRLTLAEGGWLEQAAEAAGRLSDVDRRACLALLHGQRLIPLVTHRLERADLTAHAGIGGPETFSDEIQSWKEITRRLRLVHLQVSRCLDRSGIEVIGLKGADLAWNLYPEPWLRPQRDLDLLVPETRLAEALQRLEEMGCRLDEGSRHPAHPGFWWHHHCTLVHPLGVKLELHRGLWRMPVDRWPRDFSLRGDFHDPGSMERYRRRQGELLFLSLIHI